MADSKRQRYIKRHKVLERQRSTWDTHWREVARYVNPERFRFTDDPHNEGEKLGGDIINNAPLLAAGTMAAGMATGVTSPASKWLKVKTGDQALDDDAEARAWCAAVEEVLLDACARSNVYLGFFGVYEDLATPGTAVLWVDEDQEESVRAYNLICGSYCLATSSRQRVDTCYRLLSMTVGQLVGRFGFSACSTKVQEMYERGEHDQVRRVLHVVEPNTQRDPRYIDNRNMPFRSVWLEYEGASEHDGFLRESGYEEFPIMAPRWNVVGDDVYGRSPAMRALGDAKELQTYELDKAKIIQRIADPAMKGPAELENHRVSTVPGDMTYVPGEVGDYAPAYVPNHGAIAEIRQEIAEIILRIRAAFFADLFRMLTDSDRRQVTAEEIRAKQAEKMLQMGPVLDRLYSEFLGPFVDRLFGILMRLGLIPQPPEILQGRRLKIEFVNVMAQAQKLQGSTVVEQMLGFVANAAGIDPSAVDKVDVDKTIDSYGEMLGFAPDNLRAADAVAQLRQQRAEQQQQQQALEQGQAMAAGARDLAGASLEGDSALKQMMTAISPMVGAAAGGGQ